MSNTNNNTKNQNQNLNAYIYIGTDNELHCNKEFNVDTITCTTLNADVENITTRNDYDVTGYVHATTDIIASYGTNNYSLSDTAVDLATAETNITTLQNKTQYQTASGNITNFAGGILQTTSGSNTFVQTNSGNTKNIVLDNLGVGNAGDPYLKVGYLENGRIQTDNMNTTNLNSTTITNSNDINSKSVVLKNSSAVTKATLNAETNQYDFVSGAVMNFGGTIYADYFRGTGALIPFYSSSTNSITANIDHTGQIDIQYDGTNNPVIVRNAGGTIVNYINGSGDISIGSTGAGWTASNGNIVAGNVSGTSFTGIRAQDIPSAVDCTKLADGSISNTEFQYLNNVSSNIQTQIDSKVNTSLLGANNGVATLDSNAKLTTSQIPLTLVGAVVYQGAWNASTNTPTLANPPDSSTNGYYYLVSVAGTQFSLTFDINDMIISNGSAWEKIDNNDPVVSVFGRIGAITSQTGDYTASQITNVASGNISSTNVQDAINELDSEKQPLNTKLTTISSETATSGNYLRGNGTNFVSSAIQAGDLPSSIDATKIGGGLVDNTEFGYLNGVSSAIQTQLDNKQASNSNLTTLTTSTTGDILYSSATNTLSKLGIGTNGQVLKVASGLPSWANETGGGGTYPDGTDDTQEFTTSQTWSLAGIQSIASSGLTGSPTNIDIQHVYLVDNTNGGNGFACGTIPLARGTSGTTNYLYWFNLINGTWSYGGSIDSATYGYSGYCEISGYGTTVMFLSASTSTSIDQFTYSGTTLSWTRNVHQEAIIGWGVNYTANSGGIVTWVRQGSYLYAKYLNGSTWTALTNTPFAVTAYSSYGVSGCMSVANEGKILYWVQDSGTTSKVYTYTVTGTSVNTTPAQTISFTNYSGQDGNAYFVATSIYVIYDPTDVSHPYIHIGFPNSNSTANVSTVGLIYSYEYVSGTYTYRNVLYDSTTSGNYFGYGSPSGNCLSRGGGASCFSNGSNYLQVQRWIDGHSRLYTTSKTSSGSYITYTLQQDFIWNTDTTNIYATFAIDSSGKWMGTFDNWNNTGSASSIKFFPLSVAGTTSVTYKTITQKTEFQDRVIFENAIQLPVLTSGTLGTLNQTANAGLFAINSTTNQLMVYYNNVWNSVLFGNNGGISYNTGYVQNSGDLSLNGELLDCHKLNIQTGSNASIGTSGALSSGTVTVSTTAVKTASKIFLTRAVAGGTLGHLSVGTITNATSFTITSSSSTDTSTVNWIIIN